MSLLMLKVAKLTLALALIILGSNCQIIKLTSDDIPEPKSLLIQFNNFYVYSENDLPYTANFLNYMNNNNKNSMVKFQTSNSGDNGNIQVIVLHAQESKYLNNDHFCCSKNDILSGMCTQENKLFTRDENINKKIFDLSDSTYKTVELLNSGPYSLIIANCGNSVPQFKNEILISVTNRYGYLPGTEYYKILLYFSISIIYIAFLSYWLYRCKKFFSQLISIQLYVGLIITIGLADSITKVILLLQWNSFGEPKKLTASASAILCTTKFLFSYIMLLLASIGWEITRPRLELSTVAKIISLAISFFFFSVIRDTILNPYKFRYISYLTIFCCIAPVSILNGVIFCWVINALSKIIDNLKDIKQYEKLNVFTSMWYVLVGSLIAAILGLTAQIYTLYFDITERWHFQWIATDLIPQLIYIASFSCIAWLWRPTQNSKRYTYNEIPHVELEMEAQEKTADKINDFRLTSEVDSLANCITRSSTVNEELNLEITK